MDCYSAYLGRLFIFLESYARWQVLGPYDLGTVEWPSYGLRMTSQLHTKTTEVRAKRGEAGGGGLWVIPPRKEGPNEETTVNVNINPTR
jgi:hypothetical protein